MRICIATPDIIGPVRNGGVGTACTALAQALAAAGHAVTLFYTSTYFEQGDRERWRADYARMGIRLLYLDPAPRPPLHRAPTVQDEDNLARAYHVYEALKHSDYDVIHFVDYIGLGYFTALARAQGLCLPRTRLVVTAHSPTLWSRLSNNSVLDDISPLLRDRMERGLIALCDMVISPSAYMLRWLRDQGFALPERQRVLPNLMPRRLGAPEPGTLAEPVEAGATPLREIVFFGRLEPRKGLLVFFDALDRLRGRLPAGTSVTLLGKLGPDYPRAVLERRAARWGLPFQILDGLDTFAALDHLRQPGRLAVLAALSDNSPYTVLECLHHRIPFIASDVGGVAELLAPQSQAEVLFDPVPAALAERLVAVLGAAPGAFVPALPRPGLEQAEQRMLALHEELAAELAAEAARPPPPPPRQPLVSVVILHHERPAELEQALAALARQSHPRLELLVVDNGSRDPVALACLVALEAEGRARVLRLPENLYEPEARNIGARAARGEYLLFMDDDNLPKPREVELFCRAAQAGGADVLTCFADHFQGAAPPEEDSGAAKRFLALGDAGPVGLIFNAYGDLNCFVRRDRFLAIGGFVQDRRFNHAEDWRFFAHAWAQGLRIQVVPEALFWYRAPPPGQEGWRRRDRPGALMRAAEAYLDVAPASLRPFLHLAQGLFWKALSEAAETRRRGAELERLRQENATLRAKEEGLSLENENLRKNYTALSGILPALLRDGAGDAEARERILRHVRLIGDKCRDSDAGGTSS